MFCCCRFWGSTKREHCCCRTGHGAGGAWGAWGKMFRAMRKEEGKRDRDCKSLSEGAPEYKNWRDFKKLPTWYLVEKKPVPGWKSQWIFVQAAMGTWGGVTSAPDQGRLAGAVPWILQRRCWLVCSGKHPGCNIPSAGHRGSSAGTNWDHSCRARVLHPCRGCCAVPSGQAGERGELTVLQRSLARLRPDIGLTVPMGRGSQSPLFSPLQPTLPHGWGNRGLSCQLCNVKQVSKAPPYICRLKSNSLQYKKINYPGDSRLIPLIRPAPDGKQFFFLMC